MERRSRRSPPQHAPSRHGARRRATGPFATVVWAVLLAACVQSPANVGSGLQIADAVATSQTSIVVTFDRGVDDGADDPGTFSVTGPNGASLGVLAAYPSADGLRVTLATEPQQLVAYALRAHDIGLADSDAIVEEVAHAGGFPGSGTLAPIVASAIALSNSQVLLTFFDPWNAQPAEMDDGALESGNYWIAAPHLDVLGARFAGDGADRTRVLLTTSAMSDLDYSAAVTNVVSAEGGRLVDPFANAGTFRGMATNDASGPSVVSAFPTSSDTLVVQFSEPVSDDAANPGNYVISDGDGGTVSVVSASLNDVKTAATLTTWPMTPAVAYTLVVAGISDRNGNVIGVNTSDFDGTPVGANGDATPPRVVSANSTSNTTVVVAFDEPVAGGASSAENPDAYEIVDSESAAQISAQAVVVVTDAVLSANKRSVTLTTLSQSEIGYTLKVSNVQDLAGNQVAQPDRERPYQVTFFGTGASGVPRDSDGDGLSDAEEQFGWSAVVVLASGEVTRRQVTSDPGDPSLDVDHPTNVAARDTDGDGVSDLEEQHYRTDPRNADTDDDELSDALELHAYYSDPTVQDSDGDGLTDGLEVIGFGTSPLFADTDGDGLPDDYEVVTANRNPRIADLPRPQIEIGAVDLLLDVRFETESRQGSSAVDAKSRAVTLQQEESTSTSTSDSRTNEWFFNAGATVGFEVSVGFEDPGTTYSGEFRTDAGVSGSSTFQVSNESARSSSRAYADTLSTENAHSREETLTRRVEAAEIAVLVEIENRSNIAFEMADVEITALVKDGRDPRILTPIATLFPADPNMRVHLGPLDSTARGPFRFVSREIFPARVEDLMRNPRSIVFRVANFNISDEEGRNFAFGEQEANDRTSPIVIDFGPQANAQGALPVERYRVATNSDFDADGRANGITIAHALEEIIGLTHYDEAATATSSLSEAERAASYSTFEIDGFVAIYRIRGVMPNVPAAEIAAAPNDARPPMRWYAILEDGIDGSILIRDYVLQPERGVTLSFDEDLDGDGVPARIEHEFGSSDEATDFDGDGVALETTAKSGFSDNFETFGSWSVDVQLGLGEVQDRDVYPVRSSPARVDTDGDGLTDWEEQHGCLDLDRDAPVGECDPDGLFGVSASGERFAAPTDPTNPDTDGDRILDGTEVFGFTVEPTLSPTAFVTTDPTDVDTDNDGVADGDEIPFGGNPRIADVGAFTDTDGDGLLDQEEEDGWIVTFRRASTEFGVPGELVTCESGPDASAYADCVDDGGTALPPTSEPGFGNLDTDGDGLSDAEERQLGTHPRIADTDGDGIDDFDEVNGTFVLPFDSLPRPTDPLDADSDHDTLSDGEELVDGWTVTLDGVSTTAYSDPTDDDLDGDSLPDAAERDAGTDPNDPDTDGDDSTDKVEVDRNADFIFGNDTDPLVPDQVVELTFEIRGERTLFNNICGVADEGSAYVTADLQYEINGEPFTHPYDSLSANVNVAYALAHENMRVVTASPGRVVTVGGRNVRRWDNDPAGIPYDLQDFDHTFSPTGGDLFTAIASQEFRLTQTVNNPEDCVIHFRVTLTPLP